MITAVVRKAVASDIPFIMATERRPGYEKVLGRFEEAEHAALLSDPAWIYLLAAGADGDIGFAIVSEVDNRDGNLCIKRLAVTVPTMGLGSTMLPAVLNWVFEQTHAHRLWLNVVPGNDQALRLYQKFGFIKEGVKREAARRPDGSRFDLIQMSLLRPEWAARS